jgi:hypothetical protein
MFQKRSAVFWSEHASKGCFKSGPAFHLPGLNGIGLAELIGLLQEIDRFPRATQDFAIDARSDGSKSPVRAAFALLAWLYHDVVDAFESGADLQRLHDNRLKLSA